MSDLLKYSVRESWVRVPPGSLLFNEGIKMFSKIWTALKFLICILVGPALIWGLIVNAFGEDTGSTVVYYISCFFWLSYCWNFYYPRKTETTAPKKRSSKDDDNEIDFKDLK